MDWVGSIHSALNCPSEELVPTPPCRGKCLLCGIRGRPAGAAVCCPGRFAGQPGLRKSTWQTEWDLGLTYHSCCPFPESLPSNRLLVLGPWAGTETGVP